MKLTAYPFAWAEGDALRTVAHRCQQRGLLTAAQVAAVEVAHPIDYYHPTFWIRIILFAVTVLGIVSAGLLGGLMTGFLLFPAVYCGLAMLAAVIGLEVAIKRARHYRSGLDNAFLYTALLACLGLLYTLLDNYASTSLTSTNLWRLLLPLLGALVVALVRYADPVVAVATFGTALALLLYLLLQVPLAFVLLPLVVELAAIGLHIWLRKLSVRVDYPYYRSSLLVLLTLTLITIYLAGNYLVVFSGLTALDPGNGAPLRMPLASVFYVLTAIIPIIYGYLGLRRHDRLLWVLGLVLLAFPLFTVRQFYAVLPPELAATLAGIVLSGGVLWALRYLRTPRHGLTTALDADRQPHFNLENLLVAETARVPAAPTPGFEFGGGHSGGGGAEGKF